MVGQSGARPTVYVRGIIRISYGAGRGEGGEGEWRKSRVGVQRREQANNIYGGERVKEGGKDRQAAADLFKNQGPELATVNFSSYS